MYQCHDACWFYFILFYFLLLLLLHKKDVLMHRRWLKTPTLSLLSTLEWKVIISSYTHGSSRGRVRTIFDAKLASDASKFGVWIGFFSLSVRCCWKGVRESYNSRGTPFHRATVEMATSWHLPSAPNIIYGYRAEHGSINIRVNGAHLRPFEFSRCVRADSVDGEISTETTAAAADFPSEYRRESFKTVTDPRPNRLLMKS